MDPVSQFLVKKIFSFELGGYVLNITNSALTMLLISAICICFMYAGVRGSGRVPNRIELLFEQAYNLVASMLNNIGKGKTNNFFPMVFSLFIFVLFANLYGMLPFSFSITSQFIVTGALALIVFLVYTFYGLWIHGIKFAKILVPTGTPWWLMPIMILVELVTYIMKPVSLALRLAANMCAGHILLKVIASISSSLIFAPLSAVIVSGLMAFEVGVCILQAYIFTILTCVYLNDVVNLH